MRAELYCLGAVGGRAIRLLATTSRIVGKRFCGAVTELCCAISRAANTPSSPQGVDRDCARLSDEVDVGRMREDEPEGHVSSFLYFGCIVSETHTAVLSDSFYTLGSGGVYRLRRSAGTRRTSEFDFKRPKEATHPLLPACCARALMHQVAQVVLSGTASRDAYLFVSNGEC